MSACAAESVAVEVASLETASIAARLSVETHTPLLLISTPDAAAQGGALWFLEIVRQVENSVPQADLAAVLDCGEGAGYALQALECGLAGLIYRGQGPAVARLRELADAHGARFLTQPPRALFLDDQPDPEAACRAWIKMESSSRHS